MSYGFLEIISNYTFLLETSRSLPRIHPSSVGLITAGKQGPESIFLGGPGLETPSTPPAKRAAAERAKMREGLLL